MWNIQNIKLALIICIVGVLALLIHLWDQKYEPLEKPSTSITSLAPDLSSNTNPSTTTMGSTALPISTAFPSPFEPAVQQANPMDQQFHTSGSLITVTTDLLEAKINLNGGNLIHTSILNYSESTKDKTPITLLTDQANAFYVAQSGLVGIGLPTNTPLIFTSAQTSYTQEPGQPLIINLVYQSPNGLKITKQYTFEPKSYLIKVNYLIQNQSKNPWEGRFYGQLLRVPPVNQNHNILMSYSTFTGAAYSSQNTHFEKLSFSNLAGSNLKETSIGGWVAMVQHYFISAWIPDAAQSSLLYSRVLDGNVYAMGLANPAVTVAPGSIISTGASLYVGPTLSNQLEAAAPNLNLTVDYGWLWFISELLFWVMTHIQHFIGNWGLSIIAVTILIKAVFYPLSAKSYRSMAKMRMLQPKMKEIKAQYGDDRQAIGKATMELYKKEKVNPLSGCLPILIQIPVFIALYWMLMASVELRQAPFIFWIKDLSVNDPYFILPVLMGLSMFLQQRLNPPPSDPTQAKVMMFLPVIFTALFLGFPSGLVLYWIVNNCVGILQQWYILGKVKKESVVKNAKHYYPNQHPKK